MISLFKKQAYKQQQTAHKIHKSNVTAGHNLKDSFNNQTDVNLNKLFEIFTGDNINHTILQENKQAEIYVDSENEINTFSQENSIETQDFSHGSSLSEYVPYSSYIEDYLNEDNLEPILAHKNNAEKISNKSEKQINPNLVDFDLKKAVIYSTILEPKYF